MESYSAITKCNPEALMGKWMQLEIMHVGEMVQTHLGEYCVFSLVKRKLKDLVGSKMDSRYYESERGGNI